MNQTTVIDKINDLGYQGLKEGDLIGIDAGVYYQKHSL